MNTSSDQTAVIEAVQRMTAAFHAGDIEGVMNSYEDNAVVMFEPGKAVDERAQIEQGFAMFLGMKPTFTYSGHEVIVHGDTAVHFAPWQMEGVGPDGQAIAQSGLSVAVLKRQPDGQWLMVIDNPHGQHLMQPVAQH